mgnify:CR=1 FL=1
MLKAGELRHKIEFFKKQLVDGKHGKKEVFQSFLTVKAKVTQPQTQESDIDHGKARKSRLVVFIRFNKAISEDNRLLYLGKEYDITSCRDVKGTRRELIIDAEMRQ